jgi:hypothetical protein
LLIGGIRHTAIIERGGSEEPAFSVVAFNNVFISGFTLQNSSIGVNIENSNNTIVEDECGYILLTFHM